MTTESMLRAIDDILDGGTWDCGDAMRWIPPESSEQPQWPKNEPEPCVDMEPGNPEALDHYLSISLQQPDESSFENFDSRTWSPKFPPGAWAECSCGFRFGSEDRPYLQSTVEAAANEHAQRFRPHLLGVPDAAE